jgi:lambda family phage portal protein
MKLLPGEQVTFSEPADLGGAYEQFQFRSLSAICAGMGLPYWTVTGDLRQANYSSLRAGLVEFRQRVEQLQYTVLVPQLCRPVWHAWLRTAAMAGTIPGLTPRVLARDWADVSRVEWLAPKQAWVDPEKDAKAEVLEIQAGLKSRSQAVAERGYDVEDVDRQQAEDRQRERALGLAYGMAGAVPPQRSEPDQDEAGQGEAEPAREKAA